VADRPGITARGHACQSFGAPSDDQFRPFDPHLSRHTQCLHALQIRDPGALLAPHTNTRQYAAHKEKNDERAGIEDINGEEQKETREEIMIKMGEEGWESLEIIWRMGTKRKR
jgi:hypothetical protein